MPFTLPSTLCCHNLHMLVAEGFCVSSSRRKNTLGSSPNKHVLRLACAWSVPLAVAQIIIAWVSLGFKDDVDTQHSNSVLHHFFAPYSEGTPSECGTASRCHTLTVLRALRAVFLLYVSSQSWMKLALLTCCCMLQLIPCLLASEAMHCAWQEYNTKGVKGLSLLCYLGEGHCMLAAQGRLHGRLVPSVAMKQKSIVNSSF